MQTRNFNLITKCEEKKRFRVANLFRHYSHVLQLFFHRQQSRDFFQKMNDTKTWFIWSEDEEWIGFWPRCLSIKYFPLIKSLMVFMRFYLVKKMNYFQRFLLKSLRCKVKKSINKNFFEWLKLSRHTIWKWSSVGCNFQREKFNLFKYHILEALPNNQFFVGFNLFLLPPTDPLAESR